MIIYLITKREDDWYGYPKPIFTVRTEEVSIKDVNKLEDEDTGEIFFTSVVCNLIDLESCQYDQRYIQVG